MSSNRCRILIFTQNDWFFHLHFLPLGKAFADNGADVALACLVDEHGERLEQVGIRVLPLKSLDVRSLGVLAQTRTLFELIRLMRHERPDLVLLISPKPILLGSLAAKLTGVPTVLSLMTGLGFLFSDEGDKLQLLKRVVLGALRWTHNGAGRRILFQNRADRCLLLSSGVIPENKAKLVGGVGTDLNRFKPGKPENDVPTIVFGARMIRDKGAADLVEAARILRSREIPCRVLLCGDPDPGNPNSLTDAELRGWHDEGVVEWLGHVPDIERILATSDIACLPTYYREGLPKFLLDSAAAGLALVSTNAPGCEDVIRHGENGFIVPKRNPVELADALAELCMNKQLRDSMGQRNRILAERDFSHNSFVQRVFSIVDEVASETGIPPVPHPAIESV